MYHKFWTGQKTNHRASFYHRPVNNCQSNKVKYWSPVPTVSLLQLWPMLLFLFSQQEFMPKKLFVGRLPDSTTEGDLLDYFSKFGEVIDVYIPKPMRGISFVTFASGEVAKKVQSQNHRLGPNLLNVNFAEPKSAKNTHMPSPADMQPMPSPNSIPGGWGGMGFDMYGMGSWSNASRQNLPYNASAAYNTMMQSMMNMGNPSGAAANMMANRQGRRWTSGVGFSLYLWITAFTVNLRNLLDGTLLFKRKNGHWISNSRWVIATQRHC